MKLKEGLACIDLNKIPKDSKEYDFVKRCQNLNYEASQPQLNFIGTKIK